MKMIREFDVGDKVVMESGLCGTVESKQTRNDYTVHFVGGVGLMSVHGDCLKLESETKNEDIVNSPKHYTQNGDNECIDVMRWLFGDEAVMAFCRCNIFKYRFRAGLKNGETDIDKAVWYENYLHKMLQEQSNEKDLR